MKLIRLTKFAFHMVPVLLAVALTPCEQAVRAADARGPARKRVAKRVRRLPAHYAAVVDEKQREAIYKIQEDYQPRIEALQEQLKALKKERDDKCAAVLTPEQRKKVEAAKGKSKKEAKEPAPPDKSKTPKRAASSSAGADKRS